jgi:tetratricopeptide (TPR) repeat protein
MGELPLPLGFGYTPIALSGIGLRVLGEWTPGWTEWSNKASKGGRVLMRGMLLAVAVTGIMALAPIGLRAQGDKPPSKTEPQWKDRAEYDLYEAITKDNNPQTKLEKLVQWKEKYPSTDFQSLRQRNFLMTYAAAGKVPETLNTSREMLAADPNDFYALYYTAFETPLLATTGTKPTEDQLSAGEKASNAIINGPQKPADVADADWNQIKTAAQAIAQKTLAWIALQRGQFESAEAQLKKVLAANPNDSEVSYWLGIAILSQKKTDRYSEAFFDYARAAAYDGAGALAPVGRATVKAQLEKFYTQFHGSTEGVDQLLQLAKNNPTAPPDFKIKSTADIQNEKDAMEAEAAKLHPELTLWKNIKTELTGANGATYFESSMKGAMLPELTGKVISMEPAAKPKKILISIDSGTVPDATLVFDAPLPGKVDPGTTLKFKGEPESYTANPFMVTFKVDKANLDGWTGTNPKPVTRTPVRRRPAH